MPAIDPQPLSSIPKRKRAESSVVNNDDNSSASTPDAQTIRNLRDVLASHDTKPSILQQTSTLSKNNGVLDQPSAKRTKLASPDPKDSINDRVERDGYHSLHEFASDVDNAAINLLRSTDHKPSLINGTPKFQYLPDSSEPGRLAANIKAFINILHSTINHEIKRKERIAKSEPENDTQAGLVNGFKKEDSAHKTSPDTKTVLTLYGNAQGHKQLFSSFPISMKIRPDAIETYMPLRENGLPHQIYSTAVEPSSITDTESTKTTFRDVFQPPSKITPLDPPKTPAPALTRSSSITWTQNAYSAETSKTQGYINEKLPTGMWLGYAGAISPQEPVSPEAKRKRRDRALSTGEAKLFDSEGIKAAQAQAQEDALFRSVYSSFAPCKDNSGSVIPEEVKHQIWWDKEGQEYFDQVFALDWVEDEVSNAQIMDLASPLDEEESLLKDAVEQFEPTSLEVSPMTDGEEHAATIREVSELLETLHSCQRIRNCSLSAKPLSGVIESSAVSQLAGTNFSPNATETNLYNQTKTRLACLVARLPPYVTAKLNGEQMADLNVSRRVPMTKTNYHGSMDEDQSTRLAKVAAYNATKTTATPRAGVAGTPRAVAPSQANRSITGLPPYVNNSIQRANPSYPPRPAAITNWQSSPAAYNSNMPRGYGQQPNYARTPTYGWAGQTAAQQANGTSAAYQSNPSQLLYRQHAQSFGMHSVGSPSTQNGNYSTQNPRPNSGGTPGQYQAPPHFPQSPRVPQIPQLQSLNQSPAQGVSPYVPPMANMASGNSNSRPQTPAVPASVIHSQI